MRTSVFLLAVAVCGPGVAWADPPPLDSDPDTEIARRHFEAATEFYASGRYAEAIEEFRAARKVRAAPQLDYNIARCLDRMEKFEEAAASYRRYLAAAVGAEADEVRERIRVLEARIAEDAAGRPPAREPPPLPAIGPAPAPSVAPQLAVGAVALAALVGGTALVVSVQSDYDVVQATCPHDCPEERWSDLRTRAYVGYALWGVGGAAAVADIILWIARARRGSDRPRALLLPTGSGLTAVGWF